jgi:hypothetical protein
MNEFLQLTDFDTDEVIFIAPELIKSIRQLPKDKNYGRRTVLTVDTKNMEFWVKEEATHIALATGRGFIDKVDLLKGGTEYNNSSKILQEYSNLLNNPEVLTNPQKYLGPRYNEVLEFWNKIENLTQEQLRVVKERNHTFWNENRSEWNRAANLAYAASKKVVGEDYVYIASWAAWEVADSWVAGCATRELIGNVTNLHFLLCLIIYKQI